MSRGLSSGADGAAGTAGCSRAGASLILGGSLDSSLAGSFGGHSACPRRRSDVPQARQVRSKCALSLSASAHSRLQARR